MYCQLYNISKTVDLGNVRCGSFSFLLICFVRIVSPKRGGLVLDGLLLKILELN